MAVLDLEVKDSAGFKRRLYIHADAIAFVDHTEEEKMIQMKTGERFWCICQAGYSGGAEGNTEITLYHPRRQG